MWRMDLSVHTPPVESEIVKANLVAADLEVLNEIASKVDAWIWKRTTLVDSEIIKETASRGDVWIRKRTHHLLRQK